MSKRKPPVHLLDPIYIEEMGKVLDFGNQKYPDVRWQDVSSEHTLGSLFRHVLALMRGETFDEESGLPHAAHIGVRAMMYHYAQREEEQGSHREDPSKENQNTLKHLVYEALFDKGVKRTLHIQDFSFAGYPALQTLDLDIDILSADIYYRFPDNMFPYVIGVVARVSHDDHAPMLVSLRTRGGFPEDQEQGA